MTGDEMDGGTTPIKNNDLLIIDTNVNNTSSSGIYFYITNKSVFVRRIAEIEGTGLYFSVDNPIYTDVLNDTKSYKELEEVGFKVIGKVIGNESLSSRL
jgi:phage repressor protein C with HTH and peptisase S24 domain